MQLGNPNDRWYFHALCGMAEFGAAETTSMVSVWANSERDAVRLVCHELRWKTCKIRRADESKVNGLYRFRRYNANGKLL